jgi:hypothetical protein
MEAIDDGMIDRLSRRLRERNPSLQFGWPSGGGGGGTIPVGMKDWGAFTSAATRMVNISGAPRTGGMVQFLFEFHAGEVTASSWLQLRDNAGNIVPATDWQATDRVTFPDGSLASIIVRAYEPASWTDLGTRTWTLERIAGTWPTTTDGFGTAQLSAACDYRAELTDIRYLGNPQGSSTQAAYTTPNITWSLVTALGGSAHVVKEEAGPIYTRFRIADEIDGQMWMLGFVEVWREPGTTTIRHLSPDFAIMNGWARIRGQSKAFKLRILLGATVIRDYATVVPITPADVDGSNSRLVSTFPKETYGLHDGIAAMVGGASPPSLLTAGKIYQVGRGGGAIVPDYHAGGFIQLNTLGSWNAVYTQTAWGTVSGNWTLTLYSHVTDGRPYLLRDEDGFPFWTTGGARIVPAMLDAQLKRRMETGTHHNTILATGDPAAPVNSYGPPVATAPKSRPMALLYHGDLDNSGSVLPNHNYHVGEVSYFCHNVLAQGRLATQTGDVKKHHRAMRSAGLEAIWTQPLGKFFENATNAGTGKKYGRPLVINNGPDDIGGAFADLGPRYPTFGYGDNVSNWSPGIIGSSPPTDPESNLSIATSGGQDGSHLARELTEVAQIYCDILAREFIVPYWELCHGHDFTGSVEPGFGCNKSWKGVNYYRVHILGLSRKYTQPRHYMGANTLLGYSLMLPDNNPTSAMIKKVVKTNFDWHKMFIADPDLCGEHAKRVGPMLSMPGGGNQHWQMNRIAVNAMRALKRSGLAYPECLSWYTAMGRMVWGDPIGGGAGIPQHAPGMCINYGFGMGLFDNFLRTNDDGLAVPDPRHLLSRFLDAAVSSVGAQSCWTAPTTTQDGGWTFGPKYLGNGNTLQFPLAEPLANVANGDLYRHGNASVAPPSPIAQNTWYWMYDVQTVSMLAWPCVGTTPPPGATITQGANSATVIGAGSQYLTYTVPTPGPFVAGTINFSSGGSASFPGVNQWGGIYEQSCKLSSTDPALGPPTPVTWTPGADLMFERNSFISKMLSKPRSAFYASGYYDIAYIGDYTMNMAATITMAKQCFGSEAGCDTANANYDAMRAFMTSEQGKYFGSVSNGYSAHNARAFNP